LNRFSLIIIKVMEKNDYCELCERQIERLTKHHLIPRTRHKNKRNKKNFDRTEVRERVIWICSPCHRNIHALLTEKELEYDYNTLELLKSHSGISKFLEWIKSKPENSSVRMRYSKERGK
jgi:hypothetical protein